MLKDLIYAGVGAASIIKENVEKELKNLEEKGKINKDDIKTFVSSLEERGKQQDEKIKAEVKKHIKDAMEELGLATQDDIEKLKADLLIEISRNK